LAPALLGLEFHEGMATVELPTQLLGLGKGAGERSEERADGAEGGQNDHEDPLLLDAGGFEPGVERNMVELQKLRQGIARMYVMRPARGKLTNS